jgi:hypothetical protein
VPSWITLQKRLKIADLSSLATKVPALYLGCNYALELFEFIAICGCRRWCGCAYKLSEKGQLLRSQCIILEGSWWKPHELPQVLPYFQALAATQPNIRLAHRTIRSLDDIAYWVKKIPKHSHSFLYFACHGEDLDLLPGGRRNRVFRDDLLEVFEGAKEGAISFLHFGCCEMVDPRHRRQSLQELANASRAYWVSGYTSEIDWFRSTFLDLALVAEVYVAFTKGGHRLGTKLRTQAQRFIRDYEQLARSLGFSGLSRGIVARDKLFPQRLHQSAVSGR